jgi:hypothetical protein
VMERLGMTVLEIIYERGLIDGGDGIHDGAPFALYRLRSEDAAPPGLEATDDARRRSQPRPMIRPAGSESGVTPCRRRAFRPG